MAARNLLNAYSGPDALRNYFDPDCQPMIPLVEIPQSLNPFYNDGVRIHAKMMSMHPSNNVKIMPGMYTSLEHKMRYANSNTSTEHVDERSATREVEDGYRVQLWVHSNLIGSRISHQSRDQRCTRILEQQDFSSKTQAHAILRFRRVRRTRPIFLHILIKLARSSEALLSQSHLTNAAASTAQE